MGFLGFMVVVIFGLFNIITAIFVESTIDGLQNNESKRKFAKHYEKTYVQDRLQQLFERTQSLLKKCRGDVDVDDSTTAPSLAEIELDEDDLGDILEDDVAKLIMAELD